MATIQLAGVPPVSGSNILPIIGCTANISDAERNKDIVKTTRVNGKDLFEDFVVMLLVFLFVT